MLAARFFSECRVVPAMRHLFKLYTAMNIITVLIQLAITAVTVILAVILIINSAIHAVTVIQSCLGRPW